MKTIAPPNERKSVPGTGRRSRARSDNRTGRYVRSEHHDGTSSDIAFDATFRAAAPHQLARVGRSTAISIEVTDLRQKIREKKIGNTLLFVVDSSGSMGAQRRMVETKGAVLSLLMDAYRKRDRVGLVAFKGRGAEALLRPTSSVELADRCLRELPTGGRSPLSSGLLRGYEILQADMRGTRKAKPFMFVISDGRANVSMDTSSDPFMEAQRVASEIKAAGIRSVVIDTETGFLALGRMRELSDSLGARYFRLEEIRADGILKIVDGVLTGDDGGRGIYPFL